MRFGSVASLVLLGLAGCRSSIAPDEGVWVDADGDGIEAASDCNDSDAAVGAWRRWFPDNDGDGFVVPFVSVHSCVPPTKTASDVPHPRDCNDTDPTVHGPSWLFRDADWDGFGDPEQKVWGCPDWDGRTEAGDCDDLDEDVNPLQIEVCDGIDNDCNDVVDDDQICDLSPWTPLAVPITDIDHDDVNDLLVISSAEEQALVIRDLQTAADVRIDLPLIPDAVSVSPQGGSAVVGHDGWVSEVDLLTGTVSNTWPTGVPGGEVVHGDGRAFVFTRYLNHPILSVDLTTGTAEVASLVRFRDDTVALHPSRQKIYGVTRGSGLQEVLRFDLVEEGLTYVEIEDAWSWPAGKGNVWFHPDGSALFTHDAQVYWASDDETDRTWRGELEGGQELQWLAASTERAVGLHTESRQMLTVYDVDDYTVLGTDDLPITAGGLVLDGAWVFVSPAGDAVHVVAELSDAGPAFSDLATVTIPMKELP
ncbi:MAG: putative metal-binding motif-containing protein [Myxococcales bacterium]|nr:putative metal-binding motif-containing protein [Myxococcales bacterium]